ncbi:MAG: hypothetical protein PVH88_01935 [Ignavibacteria bacterium]|jgi:hypothetical protein
MKKNKRKNLGGYGICNKCIPKRSVFFCLSRGGNKLIAIEPSSLSEAEKFEARRFFPVYFDPLRHVKHSTNCQGFSYKKKYMKLKTGESMPVPYSD